MKPQDKGTLSLFEDLPSALVAQPDRPSKPVRARTPTPAPAPTQPDAPANAATAAPTRSEQATPAQEDNALGLVRPRRRGPWSALGASVAPATEDARPHVMLVITKGEAGGAQSHVLALCGALQARVRFSVVIGSSPSASASVLGRALSARGISVYPLPAMVESLNPLKLWPAVQQLSAHIAQDAPVIVHAHSAIAGVIARLAGLRCAVPTLYTVHGFGFKPEVSWLRRHASLLAERLLAHATAQMICVSAHERELATALAIAPERMHVIANGIEPLNASQREAAKAVHQAARTTDMPRLIMVARTKAPKRHDLLLHALAAVRDVLGEEIPTTIAGDGPLTASLQAQAHALKLEHVTWLGDVSDVPAQLMAHDLFVLLSDHEGMPITVLEAMRAGLCVLASDLPGIREQLTSEQQGILVANDVPAIATQLLRLVRDPALRQALSDAAIEHVDAHFTVQRMADAVLQVYAPYLQESVAPSTSSPAKTGKPRLVSASARRRDALQSWALWGAWMLLPSLLLAQQLQAAGVMTYQFGQTLMWCVLPYAVATHLLMRIAHLPLAERSAVLWVATSAPFVFTPLGFALLQQPYSRAAVLWAYVATSAWLWWGYQRHVAHRALRLVYFDLEVPQQLKTCLYPNSLDAQTVDLLQWHAAPARPMPACDGLVLNRHVPAHDARVHLLSQLKMQHLRLYSVEAVAELISGRKMLPSATDTLWEIDNDPSYDRIKRLLDVTAVLALAPLWLPLCVCVALLVRLDSKGPALYSQARVGRDGRVFTLWKFRSMVHGLSAHGVQFAQTHDPRITRIGRVLRRTRIDELPQLFNVLMGHMSLIGPRPEQTHFVHDFAATIPSYPYRHLVRPGLTGWAQVQQGYADSADTTRIKLSYDLYYVAHYSLALDLLIAAKTVKTVCTGFGAR